MDLTRWNKIIAKKLKKVENDKTFEIIKADDSKESDSVYYIIFKIDGGHYKDQIHVLKMNLKKEKDMDKWFPANAPKVYFQTEIFHTNISPQSGWICLDILNDKWSPMNGFDTLVQTIILLLDDPAPTGNHLNADAAKLQQNSQKKFNQLAKQMTNQFGSEYDEVYNKCFEEFDTKCREKYLITKNKMILNKILPKCSKFKYEDTMFYQYNL